MGGRTDKVRRGEAVSGRDGASADKEKGLWSAGRTPGVPRDRETGAKSGRAEPPWGRTTMAACVGAAQSRAASNSAVISQV